MNVDMSIWHLVAQASPLVKTVMLLLLVASMMSWTYIFQRFMTYKKEKARLDAFERLFQQEDNPEILLEKLSKSSHTEGLIRVFQEGLHAWRRNYQPSRLESTIRGALVREIDGLHRHLPFLATVGSVSPYIGLFGTVWGIMTSFRALGTANQATLALVAPGIAEALVATAMGLFAAIPAKIAYNRYVHHVQELSNRYDTLSDNFFEALQSGVCARKST